MKINVKIDNDQARDPEAKTVVVRGVVMTDLLPHPTRSFTAVWENGSSILRSVYPLPHPVVKPGMLVMTGWVPLGIVAAVEGDRVVMDRRFYLSVPTDRITVSFWKNVEHT